MNPGAVPQLLASDPCPLHTAHVAELKAEEQARQNQNLGGTDTESGTDAENQKLSLELRATKYDQMIERLTERRLRCENQLKKKRPPLITANSMKKKARSDESINAMTYAEAISSVERVKTKPIRLQKTKSARSVATGVSRSSSAAQKVT